MVDFTELLLGLCSRSLDGSIVTDITGRESSCAASAVNFVAGYTKRLFSPADKKHPRAELGKPQSHGPAEPRAAPGEKNCAPFQQVFLKQDAPPRPNCLDFVLRNRDSIPEQNSV